MTWTQSYNPLDAAWLSTLAAAAPVVVLLGALALAGWSAPRAAVAGLFTALAIAIGVYGMPWQTALAAAGYTRVLIETVGAGQSEVDIARAAHTTIVVEAPGWGDDVQAIKAGILEIADVLVVNKADQPGAEATERALRAALELENAARVEPAARQWAVPVLTTVATTGAGVDAVIDALAAHRTHLTDTLHGEQRERQRLRRELELRVRQRLWQRFVDRITPESLDALAAAVYRHEMDLESAVKSVESAWPYHQ